MPEELERLAAHVRSEREGLLAAWHKAVQSDPAIGTFSTLTRRQFRDHIPQVLDDLASRLRAAGGPAAQPHAPDQPASFGEAAPSAAFASSSAGAPQASMADDHSRDVAALHGLHRWQQGYQLREVTREWGHLHSCLLDLMDRHASRPDRVSERTLAAARRTLSHVLHSGLSESAEQYFQLGQAESTGHVRDLEQALDQCLELERERAERWREAAHDLRGSLGVVRNASAVLGDKRANAAMRAQLDARLQRGVAMLHELLEDVLALARLHAGHEQRQVAPFDAAGVVREVCAGLEHQAQAKGLALRVEGPATLPVSGDVVKLRRILQNLLLNAVKYTAQGDISVRYGESRGDDPQRWLLSVADTGPGLELGPNVPLADALREATRAAQALQQDDAPARADGAAARIQAAVTPRRSDAATHFMGEGIGLSIVKSLCELLDATLELDSRPGQGAVFRVLLPRQY